MKLLTQAIAKKLLDNGTRQAARTQDGLEPIDWQIENKTEQENKE